MIEFRADIDQQGNLFSGRGAERVMREYTNAAERAVADEAERQIQLQLSNVLRNPTGYYQSQIGVRASGGDWTVTDNDVIYGPWLEGTGSRNQTTRFKGYATFRRVHQLMQRQAGRIAERVLQRFLRQL